MTTKAAPQGASELPIEPTESHPGGHVHGPNCSHDHDHSHHHHHGSAGETFVRATPKVGRNDPCPCASGKKFKKCCGASN